MTGEQFLYASLVAAALTVAVLLWGLNTVKHRSSRLVALQVLGATVLGLLVVLGATRLAVGFLD